MTIRTGVGPPKGNCNKPIHFNFQFKASLAKCKVSVMNISCFHNKNFELGNGVLWLAIWLET